MGQEIERKFLVTSDTWRADDAGLFCRQGYLASGTDVTVRIRVLGDKGFITIKGPTKGIVRAEYEYSIPVVDANELLDHLCPKPLIEKYRHYREHGGHKWEVDEFVGENQGLIITEIELQSAEQVVELPSWVGRDVSDDSRYYNVNLAVKPYALWNNPEV